MWPLSTKKPRRRVASVAQRRAANIRERRRMFNLNESFDKLRHKVPTFAYEKRLSRIETLRLAIMYIRFMEEILDGKDYCSRGFSDCDQKTVLHQPPTGAPYYGKVSQLENDPAIANIPPYCCSPTHPAICDQGC